MIFCINCGACNEADAVFCLSCGQMLYHGSKSSTPRIRPSRKRLSWFVVATLLIAIVVLVTLLLMKKPADLGRIPPNSSNESLHFAAPVTGKAVLTIVGGDRGGTPVKQGSGFILTPDGLAASNYHVLEGVSQAVAKCCDGRTFEIRSVEGADLDKDLVVFQLYEKGYRYKPHDLPNVILGTSQDSTVGERITTIGSPEGLENTMSDGILSAIREYDTVRLLQITAPISPGSSGGPVFDGAGKVIGIATFQFEKGQNLNFAIAVEDIRPLLDQNLSVSLAQFQSLAKQTVRGQSGVASSHSSESPPERSQAVARPFTGQFAGVVHNLSVNVSAEFVIVVNDADSVLSGCMGVRQPLFGSGPLSGVVEGSDLSFVVTSAIGEITFVGQRSEGSINGTYTVKHQNAPNEEGTFTLRKIKSTGLRSDFDTSNCPTDAEMNQ